ncbi:MAG: selenium cofactor biosynthesis protein YqeC [Desulfobacteraceae bacterium]|jgi:probable selenium-dependent hydroxylase accessory protein YqeC
MEHVVDDLISALDPAPSELLALVGGGGKSTLLLALTRALSQKGRRVLATTTTKVWFRQALEFGHMVLTDEDGWRDRLHRALETDGAAFLARRRLPTGKAEGISTDLADLLFECEGIDHLLVEADGAARRPLKAPEPSEPVLPGKVTRVVAMAGLDALGKTLQGDLVFRMDRFQSVTGLGPGDLISAGPLVSLFTHEQGLFQGTPEGVRRTVFLNRLDLTEAPEAAEELAAGILDSPWGRDVDVILGSLEKQQYTRMTRT